jgi:nucleoside-diphosphate-sugar epimerase
MAENHQKASSKHRVLIIGGASVLGRRLIRRLAQKNYSITAFSRNASKSLDGLNIKTVDGDICELNQLAAAAEGCSYIVNCACSYSERTARSVNVDGARNVAIAASRVGVKRVLHISTISVYPKTLDQRHTESDPLRPVTGHYQTTKQAGEKAFREVCDYLFVPWTCIRPGGMFGPECYWSKLAVSGLPWYNGYGNGTLFAVYIDDVVRLCELVLTHVAAEKEVFNAVLDPPPSWREFCDAHARLAQSNPRRKQMANPLAEFLSAFGSRLPEIGGGRLHRWYLHLRSTETWSTEKAQTLLGWRASTGLAEGVTEYGKWLQSSPIHPFDTTQ